MPSAISGERVSNRVMVDRSGREAPRKEWESGIPCQRYVRSRRMGIFVDVLRRNLASTTDKLFLLTRCRQEYRYSKLKR